MSLRFVSYLCILFFGGVAERFVWTRITKQVNQHLPRDKEYSLSIWTLWRSAWGEFNQFRIWRTHRRLFPDSYLPVWHVAAFVLTVFWMFFGLTLLKRLGTWLSSRRRAFITFGSIGGYPLAMRRWMARPPILRLMIPSSIRSPFSVDAAIREQLSYTK